MVFGKHAFFGYTVRSSGEVYWFANLACPDEPTPGQLAAVSPGEWQRRLLALYVGDTGPAAAIVQATARELAAYPVHDLPAVPTWHRGPMVIIGDAAHATSPSSRQGASLAIEDAVVLAKCLRDVPESARALEVYEPLRRARVERVVKYSARIGRSKTAGPIKRWLRDLFMPMALKRFANPAAHAWLYAHDVGWDQRAA